MTEMDWQARCIAHGLSMTAPRRAILAALQELDQPCDAVALLQAACRHHLRTRIGTVYRFLRELEQAGLVRAQAQPHGRIRWQLTIDRLADAPAASELRGMLQQIQGLLHELDRLGLVDALLMPSSAPPRHAGNALELLAGIAEQLGYRLLPQRPLASTATATPQSLPAASPALLSAY